MADVNEEFSRLFFEECGFLVRTNVKYYIKGDREVGGDADIDLVAYNLKPDKLNPPSNFVLNVPELKRIDYAIVETKGWHEITMTPARIEERIFNFTGEEATNKAKEVFNTAHFKRILIIPSLPLPKKTRNESIRKLKDGKVDHIIEFKTMMETLWNKIEPNKNYQSEILQTMRLVKKYLIKGE